VLSCDNLQGNGDVARQSVCELAKLVDEGLAEWISSTVSFPSCMVDRITPATTQDDRAVLAREFGLDDGWPVPAEPFSQWIVEDRFPLGRPPLERVGVQFVEDVRPYELMKLRLLNASHQALAYFGAPLGYVLVDETMRDDRIREYLERYMADEAAPTLGELPGIDLGAYMATLLERFANPGVKDTLVRLATDGSNRMATFTLPTVRANLAAGSPVRLGAAMCAAWAEYWALIGRGEISGREVPEDVYSATLAASALDDDPAAFIELPSLWGDLANDSQFRAAFLETRHRLAKRGVHGTLDALLGR
jgi:mannitol 2-dehydrogenase